MELYTTSFSTLFHSLFNPFNLIQYHNIHNINLHTFFLNQLHEEYESYITAHPDTIYEEFCDFLLPILYNLQNPNNTLTFINSETGEIIKQIPLTAENLNKNITELLGGSFLFMADIALSTDIDPVIEEDEYETIVEWTGGKDRYEKDYISYKDRGLMIHTSAYGSDARRFDSTFGNFEVLAIDAETGVITDIFQGVCNRFQEVVIAKALRGDRFFLYFQENGSWYQKQINQTRPKFNGQELWLRCNKKGEWKSLGWFGKDFSYAS